MSKADKMFEELGYEIDKTKGNIRYFKDSINIWFWRDTKEFDGMYGFESKSFNMQELQAINEKCKELRMDIGEAIKICKEIKRPILATGFEKQTEILEAIEIALTYLKVLEEANEIYEEKTIELQTENEHYKDLMNALETYYTITEEDLENSVKEDV